MPVFIHETRVLAISCGPKHSLDTPVFAEQVSIMSWISIPQTCLASYRHHLPQQTLVPILRRP